MTIHKGLMCDQQNRYLGPKPKIPPDKGNAIMPFGEEYSEIGIPGGKQHEKFKLLYGSGPAEQWHLRMMLAAEFFGSWSKCMSRKIGAVIVRDKTILATGYNGPPRGVPECHTEERYNKLHEQIMKDSQGRDDISVNQLKREWGTKCPRQIFGFKSGQGLHMCTAGHAESNAVANAAREGVRISGADMYCYCPLPCMNCAKMIIGAGLSRVFYVSGKDYDTESRWMLLNAGISLVGITSEMIEKYRQSLQ
jgi:dCMP deaminase